MPHLAWRAVQMARPWSTRRWQKLLDSSGGRISRSCFSTLPGSLVPSVRPRRPEIRMQWVSATTTPGVWNTSPKIRLAVLRPTPGSATSSSMVPGTFPPCWDRSIWAHSTRSRLLARKNPQEWMYSPTSSTSAWAKASRVGKRAKRAGVTWLTRSSVHWADSRTAKSNS